MKKLHRDGLLTSFDFESFDTCEACLMGKLARTPFNGNVEQASDLLEIIHTDVRSDEYTGARWIPLLHNLH